MTQIRLGVNIDHVATVRNARGGSHPDPAVAARLVADAGADGITAHLREDRRHIRDHDIPRIQAATTLPLNLEMAATDEMLAFAIAHHPHAACIVPEKRQELTTEGGLDASGMLGRLKPICAALRGEGIRVSLFIEADRAQVEAAAGLAVDAVELHTGRYCHAVLAGDKEAAATEYDRLADAAAHCQSRGLECHAGHGLTYATAQSLAAIPQIAEVNIGHFLIGEAICHGLPEVITRMRAALNDGRKGDAA